MSEILKRTWAEINLDAIARNYNSIKSYAGVKIMAVVKADAYGHGAEQAASLFCELGADYLAVSNIEEAIQIRAAGVVTPILILGYTPIRYTETLIENNLTQTVFDLDFAAGFSREAASLNRKLKVHIKADTGMTRLGFLYDGQRDTAADIVSITQMKGLDCEGIFTHFSRSDEENCDYTKIQLERFKKLIYKLEAKNIRFKLKHTANSGAVLNYPETWLDMIRPGLILYGIYPDGKYRVTPELIPAMKLCSAVSQIKEVGGGTPVSYGASYITPGRRKLAVIPIGYADGLPRHLSNKGYVMAHGQKVPIVGNICMDMCMADVTGIEGILPGSQVTLFGDGISADEIAAMADTIPYEIICLISKRVPRIFFRNNEQVGFRNYII